MTLPLETRSEKVSGAAEPQEDAPAYEFFLPLSVVFGMLGRHDVDVPEIYRPQLRLGPDLECGGCGGPVWVLSHDHDGTGIDEYEPAFLLCHPCDSVRRRADIERLRRLRGWPGGPCAEIPAVKLYLQNFFAELREIQEQSRVERTEPAGAPSRQEAPSEVKPPASRKRGLKCRRCGEFFWPDSRKSWCRVCRDEQSERSRRQLKDRREQRAKERGARAWMEEKRRRGNYDPDFAQRLYEGVVILRASEDGEMPYEPWPWGNGPAL